MRLLEFTDEVVATGHYDPAEDRMNTRNLGDTRKPVLTLRKLNKLKKMRAVRQLEALKRQDLMAVMYGDADSDRGRMGGGFSF
jgi:hypothetical protein